MIDSHIDAIESIRNDGGILLIKWDGGRRHLRQTVVVTRADTDYVWRKDCDDVDSALSEAIDAYRRTHPR